MRIEAAGKRPHLGKFKGRSTPLSRMTMTPFMARSSRAGKEQIMAATCAGWAALNRKLRDATASGWKEVVPVGNARSSKASGTDHMKSGDFGERCLKPLIVAWSEDPLAPDIQKIGMIGG